MGAERTKPGLFAYMWAEMPATPSGAYQWVGLVLQATAGLGLAYAGLFLGLTLRSWGGLLHLPWQGTLWSLVPLFVLGIMAGWAVAWSWFLSYAYFYWTRRDLRGLRNASALGWIWVIFGAPAL